MSQGFLLPALAACAALLVACGRASPPPPDPASPPPVDASTAGRATPVDGHEAASLNTLFEQYFEDYLALNPTVATAIGDYRYDDRMAIYFGPEYRASLKAQSEHYRDRALAIDPAGLDAADRLSRELFIRFRETTLEGLRFPGYLLPLDQMNSFANAFAAMGSGQGIQPFRTALDYDNFLARMEVFSEQVDVAIENMREGMLRGVVLPRIAVERLVPQVSYHVVARPEDSVFFGPVGMFPDSLSTADRERLSAAYREAIIGIVVPAYRRLRDFLVDEYMAAARETISYSELPDGREWYDFLVRYHTTTDLSPERIHEIGLSEVRSILDQMDQVRRQVGFSGNLREFFHHLGSDPRFFWADGEEALRDYRSVAATVDRVLPDYFSVFPAAGFEIRPVEAFRAESAASASYQSPSLDGSRPGVFYLNTHNIARLPRWGMVTLFLHEASPGHHFQGTLNQENTRLPRFRRFGWVTAYTEGWALYAEDLGVEMQMFTDPYQYFGKLNDEMLRALRLVVDTGIHRMGWTREQAIRYMLDNSSIPELEVVPEVERYIVYPGQALAYKMGQLRLRELRAEAETALGERFDLRSWHDMVLLSGEVPLDLLTRVNDRWIADRR